MGVGNGGLTGFYPEGPLLYDRGNQEHLFPFGSKHMAVLLRGKDKQPRRYSRLRRDNSQGED